MADLVKRKISDSLSCYFIKRSEQSQHKYYTDIKDLWGITMGFISIMSSEQRSYLFSPAVKSTHLMINLLKQCEWHIYDKIDSSPDKLPTIECSYKPVAPFYSRTHCANSCNYKDTSTNYNAIISNQSVKLRISL